MRRCCVSGNGGPPSPSNCGDYKKWKTCIAQPYSYTKLVAHNATDLTWTQVSNKDGSARQWFHNGFGLPLSINFRVDPFLTCFMQPSAA